MSPADVACVPLNALSCSRCVEHRRRVRAQIKSCRRAKVSCFPLLFFHLRRRHVFPPIPLVSTNGFRHSGELLPCLGVVFWCFPASVRDRWLCGVRFVRYRNPSWIRLVPLSRRKYGLFRRVLLSGVSPLLLPTRMVVDGTTEFAGAPCFTMARLLTWVLWVSPPRLCSR